MNKNMVKYLQNYLKDIKRTTNTNNIDNEITEKVNKIEEIRKFIDRSDSYIEDNKSCKDLRNKKIAEFGNNIEDLQNFDADVFFIDEFQDSIPPIVDFVKELKNVKKVEILPYHTLGVAKWKALKLPYGLEGVNPPSDEFVSTVRSRMDKITNN